MVAKHHFRDAVALIASVRTPLGARLLLAGTLHFASLPAFVRRSCWRHVDGRRLCVLAQLQLVFRTDILGQLVRDNPKTLVMLLITVQLKPQVLYRMWLQQR